MDATFILFILSVVVLAALLGLLDRAYRKPRKTVLDEPVYYQPMVMIECPKGEECQQSKSQSS